MLVPEAFTLHLEHSGDQDQYLDLLYLVGKIDHTWQKPVTGHFPRQYVNKLKSIWYSTN